MYINIEVLFLVGREANKAHAGFLQHFAENEFFSDKVIKKVYKFAAKEVNAEDEKPLYYGVTRRVLEFNWIEDVEIEVREFRLSFFLKLEESDTREGLL